MNLRQSRFGAAHALAAVAAALLAGADARAQSYLATGRFRVIAQTGQLAPTGETLTTPYLPSLDGQGRASFRALVASSSSASRTAIFAEREGQIATIFHPDVVYGTAAPYSMNDTRFSRRGDFAGISFISFSSHGFFAGQHDGPIELIAADGHTPPGRPQNSFNSFWDTVISDGGHAVFNATIDFTQPVNFSRFGVWKHTPGVGLQEIAVSDTQIPSAGRQFSLFGGTYLFVNAHGDVVIPGRRDLNNGTAPDETTIWKHSGGVLSAIVKDGDPAPVGVDGSTFWVVQEPSIDAAGNVAFFGAYTYPTGGGGQGVFKSVDGQILPIAYGGQSAPGTNFVFSQINGPGMNARGDVSFNANLVTLSTGKSIGVFRQLAGGPLELVAKNGDVAPGTGGATFKNVGWPTLSSDGAVAFIGSLQGAGVTTANDYGLWLEGPAGLTLVARKGDMVELAPGDVRQISAIQFDDDYNSSDQGALTGLGPGYQAAMLLTFADDSKAMVATVHAAGDYNGDARVDGADFLAWQLSAGATGLAPGTSADGNMDGQVDGADLQVWRDALDATVTTVPEPAAWSLLLLLSVLATRRQR